MAKLTVRSLILASVVLYSGASFADHFSVTYPQGKPAGCNVTFDYYDGDSKTVTCSITDSSERSASNSFRQLSCESTQKIRHLNADRSGVIISAKTNNGASCSGVRVEGINVVKTAGSDVKKKITDYHELGSVEGNYDYAMVDLLGGHLSDSECSRYIKVNEIADKKITNVLDLKIKAMFHQASSSTSSRYASSCNASAFYIQEDKNTFSIIEGFSERISIKSVAGEEKNKYVTVDERGTVNVSKPSMGDSETFIKHSVDGPGTPDSYVLFETLENRFLCTEKSKDTYITAKRLYHDTDCYFLPQQKDNGSVVLRSYAGNYVHVVTEYGNTSSYPYTEVERLPSTLKANYDALYYAGPSEDFAFKFIPRPELIDPTIVSTATIALKSFHGTYVAAQNGGGSYLKGYNNWIGNWETFNLEVIDLTINASSNGHLAIIATMIAMYKDAYNVDEFVALKTIYGYYVCGDGNGGLYASETAFQECYLGLIYNDDGSASFITPGNNKYVTVESNRSVVADRAAINGWQKFTIEYQ